MKQPLALILSGYNLPLLLKNGYISVRCVMHHLVVYAVLMWFAVTVSTGKKKNDDTPVQRELLKARTNKVGIADNLLGE